LCFPLRFAPATRTPRCRAGCADPFEKKQFDHAEMAIGRAKSQFPYTPLITRIFAISEGSTIWGDSDAYITVAGGFHADRAAGRHRDG
jgi:hypothetical protein